MNIEKSKNDNKNKAVSLLRRLYNFLAPRACTAIIFATLFCTLAVKLFHACRTGLLREYPSWIIADLIVLFITEFILMFICFHRPRKSIVRATISIAAILCTWSVFNAGWLIATGTQILPSVLASLIFDPINRFVIIGHRLALQPLVALILLGPSAIALVFLFMVLAKPVIPKRNVKFFINRIITYAAIVLFVFIASTINTKTTSNGMISKGLRYNSQLKAITSIFSIRRRQPVNIEDLSSPRSIPHFDQITVPLKSTAPENPYNVVIVILEGIGYKHTSLYNTQEDRTPYLKNIAEQGVVFTNTRPPLTHSTKGFFSILTGRLPSISGDYVEAVPVRKPYASIATILTKQLNYRTAFFQSAKGSFECRPGLVHNLGFDKYWAREYIDNQDAFLGYLAADEFILLEPIENWIKQEEKPFLLTLVLSATHDPYEVPEWYGENTGEPVERYHRAVTYTDLFIKALDDKLAELNCTENTVFCIIGDHGEAFGEHQRFGHDLIPFEEALRIVWLIRAPGLTAEKMKINESASSIDVTPTILGLMGFNTNAAAFDGIDILKPHKRDKVYFSGWVDGSFSGYIKDNMKYIYDPTNQIVVVYDLGNDPNELHEKEITGYKAEEIIADVTQWKDNTFTPLFDWGQIKEVILYDYWRVYRLKNREPSAKYEPELQE